MTKKQFERLGEEIAAENARLVVTGPLVFQKPLKHFLRGLCFDGSSFSKDRFYIQVFAMPLYVPHDHIAFTLGNRIRCGRSEGWDNHSGSLLVDLKIAFHQQAEPWLADHDELSKCVDKLSSQGDGNPNHAIAAAFGELLLGKTSKAMRSIESLIQRVDRTVKWQQVIAEQAQHIEGLVRESEIKAREQLEAWEQETLRALKLSPMAAKRYTIA